MDVQGWGRRGLVGGTLLSVAMLWNAAPVALGAETPDALDVSTIVPAEEPVERVAFDDTLTMFEDAGFTAYDGRYAGLVVFESRGDHLVMHLAKNEPQSAEAIRVALALAATAPAPVRIEYLEHAWSDVADFVTRLADPNDSLNKELGLESVRGVFHHELDETIAVHVSDPALADRGAMIIDGVRVTIVVSELRFTFSSRIDDALS